MMRLLYSVAVFLSAFSSGCFLPHFPPPTVLDVRSYPDGQEQMPWGFRKIVWGFENGQPIIVGSGYASAENRFHIIFLNEPFPYFENGWVWITCSRENPTEWNVRALMTINNTEMMLYGCIIIERLTKDGTIKIPFRNVHLYSENYKIMVELSGTMIAQYLHEEQLQEYLMWVDYDASESIQRINEDDHRS